MPILESKTIHDQHTLIFPNSAVFLRILYPNAATMLRRESDISGTIGRLIGSPARRPVECQKIVTYDLHMS